MNIFDIGIPGKTTDQAFKITFRQAISCKTETDAPLACQATIAFSEFDEESIVRTTEGFLFRRIHRNTSP